VTYKNCREKGSPQVHDLTSCQCKLFTIQEPVKSFSVFRGMHKSLCEINLFFLNFEFEKTETGRGVWVVFERCAAAVGSRKINVMAQLCGDCIVVGGVCCHLPFLLRRTKLTFDYFRNSDITSVFER
jgi:hypothetical protein